MRFLVFAAVVAATAAAPAVAQAPPPPVITYKAGALVIETPWMRQPPDGARVAGGYLRITNTGPTSDRLVSGTAPFAKRLEVHEMSMDGGVMKMRELPQGLEIKPGATVELKPGGLHVMYMDIMDQPKAGDQRKTTLVFEKAGQVDIDVAVVPRSQNTPAAKSHQH
jgi:periplasmic copper chaperone A